MSGWVLRQAQDKLKSKPPQKLNYLELEILVLNTPEIIKPPITNLEFLKKLIPHREPMILVDTLQYHDSTSLISRLLIAEENLFVIAHQFSEAGILEHMAQSVALHTGYSGYLSKKATREGYIGAIKKAEILQLPKVGEIITTQVTISYSAMDMTLVTIESKVNEKLIATAEMSTVLKPIAP
ncbi:hypothetical protein [Rasiella sp. SM2506]|uniref:hypothetical protein n=1 Tax=Rasiella sp. SM2506 TaxID=3423914 RepID=UPI003D7BECF4